jgi:hypothetical protein
MAEICQLFYFTTKNVTTHSILSVFNEDSKMGCEIFCTIGILKVIVIKNPEKYNFCEV